MITLLSPGHQVLSQIDGLLDLTVIVAPRIPFLLHRKGGIIAQVVRTFLT
jgi:hypothetical protein